jgi:predicted DCC family thiol-disulfide oxidoreductase YuxK
MNQITVIYDGQCEFCLQSVTWIQRKLEATSLPFQTAELAPFNLTREQCAKQVYVIAGSITYAGADAIAFLLNQRGNKVLSLAIRVSGKLGHAGYKWIATHRSSWPIKAATKLLTFLSR